MDNILRMQIVNSFEDLSYCVCRVFLGEATLFADTVEQLTTSCQLCDDVVFVLSNLHQQCPCCASFYLSSYSRLEPIHKLDDVRVV